MISQDLKKQIRLEDSGDIYGEFEYFALVDAYVHRGLSIPKGQNAVPTRWALENGVFKKDDKLKVVGLSRDGKSVKVLKNKNKFASNYWPGFIQQE